MPSPSQYKLPLTQAPKEFELMVKEYCISQYSNAEMIGRMGQKQKGLDILIKNEEAYIGVQCKNYTLSVKEISGIIKKAEEFDERLETFIIATSGPRDVKLQEYIRKNNKNFEIAKEIKIIFWDDIVETMGANEDFIKKFYPQFFYSGEKEYDIEELKKDFNKAIYIYDILKYIQKDPVIEGMTYILINNMDGFQEDMREYLNKAILFQKESVYIYIEQFCTILYEYNNYLSTILHPTNNANTFCIQNQYLDKKKILEQVKAVKEELNNCYSKINADCKIFC